MIYVVTKRIHKIQTQTKKLKHRHCQNQGVLKTEQKVKGKQSTNQKRRGTEAISETEEQTNKQVPNMKRTQNMMQTAVNHTKQLAQLQCYNSAFYIAAPSTDPHVRLKPPFHMFRKKKIQRGKERTSNRTKKRGRKQPHVLLVDHIQPILELHTFRAIACRLTHPSALVR